MDPAGFLKWRKLERERLALEKKMKSPGELLEGSLIERRISCGRNSCRCAGGNLHGPYYYLSKSVRGKTVMTYLSGDRRRVLAARNYREFQKSLTRWRGVVRGIERIFGGIRNRQLIRKGD